MKKALRYVTGKRHTVLSRIHNAAECIGELNFGDEITGLTCGQFSSIDILEHMLNELGGGDVSITTWTSGIYDVERAGKLKETGLINSIRFLLDKINFSKSPQYSGVLIDVFGVESFRDCNIHSKITIVKGKKCNAVMRSSMNLNKNLKTEQFDISVNDDVFEFYQTWFDELWRQSDLNKDAEKVFLQTYDKFQKLKGKPRDYGGLKSMSEIAKSLQGVK